MNRLNSGQSNQGYTEQGINYDLMGNITQLTRLSPIAASMAYGYSYSGNQLTSLAINGTSVNYTYDPNGNVVQDGRSGNTFSVYNLLNLPQTISTSNGTVTYVYNANGEKLSKTFTGTNSTLTEYVGGLEYDGGNLQFVKNEEGRAIRSGNNFNYEYSLTDHLGNTRVTLYTPPGTTNPVQTDDYYPFGIEISNAPAPGLKNEYLYNGKEKQEETGLYDYGARFYDPVIGRWGHIDEKAELYFATSPYAYALNQPTNAIDPNGKLVIFINGLWLSYWSHSPGKSSPDYWTSNITFTGHGISRTVAMSTDQMIMNQLNDHHADYYDGQRGGTDAMAREKEGLRDGLANAKSIIDNLSRDPQHNINESIKIISHSMGGVYAKGFVYALKQYIKTLPIAIQKQIKITLVADFDPFQIGDFPADPDIKTMQFKHSNGWNWFGLGWLANETEPGAIQGKIDEDDSSDHAIVSFVSEFGQLKEGTYIWNEKEGKFVLQQPNKKQP